MVGIVKEIDGQKKIIPLTSDTGTGAPVGTLISQYKKVAMSGYLYCDGSTFDQNAYPALYMYLGTNVLPDYRECVMVGAEQNTTDTIATHDVYGEGEFKDDQLQNHQHYESANAGGSEQVWGNIASSNGQINGWLTGYVKDARTGDTNTTHGKQKAVYVYIKATSGLAENQQENVLNDVKEYVNSSNSYSTDEVKTGGKWIDGKPIYRKVVNFGALPNASEKTVTFDVINDDTWVSITAIAKKSADGTIINIPYTDVNNIKAGINYYIKNNSIVVNTGVIDRSDFNKCYFILEYTKTTD